MPGGNGPSNEYLLGQIQQLQSQYTALSQQGQYVVVDQNLKLRVQIGLLQNGDYGILLADPASGAHQELLPSAAGYTSSTLVCTSTTPQTLSGSPTVSVTIGASFDAKVSFSAIQTPSGSTNISEVYIVGTRTSGPSAPAGTVTSFTATAFSFFGLTWTGAPPEVPTSSIVRLSQLGLVCAPGAGNFAHSSTPIAAFRFE